MTSRQPCGAQPPIGHARQRDSVWPRRPRTRAHSTWATGPGYPPQGWAAGGGRAPGPRCPSQRRGAPAQRTPSRHPHSTRACTLCDRCWVCTATPPTPRKRGQRRKVPHPGRPPAAPTACNTRQGTHATGAVTGPHTRTAAPTARGQQTPTLTTRPEDAQPGEDERLTSGAPHNGAGHPPEGCLQPIPQHAAAHAVGPLLGPNAHIARARDARATRLPGCPLQGRAAGRGRATDTRHPSQHSEVPPPRGDLPLPPRRATARRARRPMGQCRVPTPTQPRPRHAGSGPRPPASRGGSRERMGAQPHAPITTARGVLAGDALPPPQQRTTPARKSARTLWGWCGVPMPAPPTPRGRAAENERAPVGRRPSQWRGMQPPAQHPPGGTRVGNKAWLHAAQTSGRGRESA